MELSEVGVSDRPGALFRVVDNGTADRGDRCQQRLAQQWPNLIVVRTPIHASWLNQVESFSMVQRKILTPDDFRWRFTRRDLDSLLV
jgi:hypothetical protein